MLFIEHYAVVCATVLKESYPLVEHCFILLQEATENKKDLNEKLKKNDTLAAELVWAIQIQQKFIASLLNEADILSTPPLATSSSPS